jgi:uncharacterized protein YecE (DUF72 family)
MAARAAKADVRVGISGWTYGPWRGVFYPQDLPQKRELAFASRQLNSIEINGSFYSLQRPTSYAQWYDATPRGFVFSVKGPRFITHMKKLKDARTPLANFFASGVFALKEKLGPILWQFPPGFAFNERRFSEFFELLPRDTRAAAALSRGHDHRLDGRSLTSIDRPRKLRYAVEVRHESFLDARFITLLRRHRIALVFADTAGRWPYAEDVTGDLVYLRLHGDAELYVSGYSASALGWWARRIGLWTRGREPGDARRVAGRSPRRCARRDAFVYFDNDAKVYAPFDAMALACRLGLKEGEPPCRPELVVQEQAYTAAQVADRWRPRAGTRSRGKKR